MLENGFTFGFVEDDDYQKIFAIFLARVCHLSKVPYAVAVALLALQENLSQWYFVLSQFEARLRNRGELFVGCKNVELFNSGIADSARCYCDSPGW